MIRSQLAERGIEIAAQKTKIAARIAEIARLKVRLATPHDQVTRARLGRADPRAGKRSCQRTGEGQSCEGPAVAVNVAVL